MPLWMKKLFVIVVLGGSMVMMTGGWTAHEVVSDMANRAQAATVNPLYQLACPSDAGVIPSWLCTQLTQENNNNSALRSAINNITALSIKSRVVTISPDVGTDGAYADVANASPSATATRLIAGYNVATCVVGGDLDGGIIRCETITTNSDSTTTSTDGAYYGGNPDMQFDASSSDAQGKAMTVLKKDGTYITAVGIRCMNDAGLGDATISCTLYLDEI